MSTRAALLLLAACTPYSYAPPPTGGSTPSGAATGTATGTTAGTSTTDTGTTTTTGTDGPFDCATIPVLPTSVGEIDGARGYHDVAFDDDGHIIGTDGSNLVKVLYDGTTSVFAPGIGGVQGLEWLPDGDLAVASDALGSILRVDPSGSSTTLATNIQAYGLVMGPDGYLYASNDDDIYRIDVTTGTKTVWLARGGFGWGVRSFAFSRDFTRVYLGTTNAFLGGELYYVDLDANYDPVGDPLVLASGVGTGGYHDGMGVDVCGYIYVPDYDTSCLYRISPDGSQVQQLLNVGIDQYGHGLEWGSGIGGWRSDALYQPLPYGAYHVLEVVIGVPKVWNGPILNAP